MLFSRNTSLHPFDFLFTSIPFESGERIYSPTAFRSKEGRYVAEIEIPGFAREEISVTTEGKLVHVRAEKDREGVKKKFDMKLSLPENLNKEGLEATLEHGVLLISAPELASSRKKIEIKVG